MKILKLTLLGLIVFLIILFIPYLTGIFLNATIMNETINHFKSLNLWLLGLIPYLGFALLWYIGFVTNFILKRNNTLK